MNYERPTHRVMLIQEADAIPGRTLDRPERVATYFALLLGAEPSEAVAVAWLDSRLRMLGSSVVFRGAMTRCTAEPRGLIVPALLANAHSIVVAHNHPSGDPTVSPEDVAFTRRLRSACDVIGLGLVDSLVIGHGGHYRQIEH